MNRSIVFKVIMALILVGALVGLGIFAYQAGFAQGTAQSAQLQSGEVPAPINPYYYGLPYARPFFGFGFLACLVPLFLLFLFFFALRGLFGHGPHRWGGMHRGPWGNHPGGGKPDWSDNPPPFVEEWHRKMHGGQADQAGVEQV